MAAFVYVSLSEEGAIASYRLEEGGRLVPGPRANAPGPVMPMAVSPDRRRLYAAVRSKPFPVHVFVIDSTTGALRPDSKAELAESCPYIALDAAGRTLIGASYGAHLVCVSPVSADGRVGATGQVIPIGRNAHAVQVDRSNRFVYVPALGSDQIFQFVLDARSGRLASNSPALVQMEPGAGPRHLALSADNRFLYVLSELTAVVATFALDASTGLLAEVATTPGLAPDCTLRPGTPRGPDAPPRERENDIWAADLHLTPDGRFLYASERTSSTINAFSVDAAKGKLAWFGATPTEKQPRGFAIDPRGRFLIASGEKSEKLSVYAIDGRTGALDLKGRYPAGKGANWVEIVEIE